MVHLGWDDCSFCLSKRVLIVAMTVLGWSAASDVLEQVQQFALHTQAISSSTALGSYMAYKATDGDQSTQWVSADVASVRDTQWLDIDLGSVYTASSFRILLNGDDRDVHHGELLVASGKYFAPRTVDLLESPPLAQPVLGTPVKFSVDASATAMGTNSRLFSPLNAFDSRPDTLWVSCALRCHYIPAAAAAADSGVGGTGEPGGATFPIALEVSFLGGAAHAVAEYTLTGHVDPLLAGRDPTAWSLQGSHDGGATWAAVDARVGQLFETGEPNTYAVPLPSGAASHRLFPRYRLLVSAVRDSRRFGNAVALAEMQLRSLQVSEVYTPSYELVGTFTAQRSNQWQELNIVAPHPVNDPDTASLPESTSTLGPTNGATGRFFRLRFRDNYSITKKKSGTVAMRYAVREVTLKTSVLALEVE